MNRLASLLLLSLAIFAAAAAGPAEESARADGMDYNRGVEVNWEPYAGAVRYDVEWYTGSDCGVRVGGEPSSGPSWGRRLPAGNYCVRVRAVDASETAGQWTDFFRLDVKPKPPADVRQAGNRFEWDAVPYAKGYSVELVDGSGRALTTADVAGTDFTVPDKFMKNPGYRRDGMSLRVRTQAEGVPPSAPQSLSIHGEGVASSLATATADAAAGGGASAGPAGSGPITAVGTAGAARTSPVAPAEAIERYTLTGEKPVPPTRKEWARALAPEQRENLRQRTIAGARVELLDRLERKAPPDLRIGLGVAPGSYRYFSLVASDFAHNSASNGFSPAWRLDVDYNRDRPWGAFLHVDQQTVGARTIASSYTAFALGVEYHGDLDSLRESVLSLGAGFELSKVPFPTIDSSSPQPAVFSTIPLYGFRARLTHRLRLGERWSWETGLTFRFAPTQTVVPVISADISQTGGEIALGPAFRISRELEIGAAASVRGLKTHDESGDAVTLVNTELVLRGVYRMGPSEERRPAAEASFQAAQARPWEIRLTPLIGFRAEDYYMGGVGKNPPNNAPVATSTGLEAAVERRLSADGPFSVGGEWSQEGFTVADGAIKDQQYGVHFGYEHPLLRRLDARLRYRLGYYRGTLALTGTDGVVESRFDGLAAGVALEKSWSPRIDSELGARFAHPLSSTLFTTDHGSFSGDPAGFNAEWRIDAAMGYRLGEAVTLWGGYAYLQKRQSSTTTVGGEFSVVQLHSTEGQFRLGLGLRW